MRFLMKRLELLEDESRKQGICFLSLNMVEGDKVNLNIVRKMLRTFPGISKY